MPLSDAARQAIRVVTARYPDGAQRLLDRVRTAPELDRRWPTRYGPLTTALLGNPALPPEESALVEAFGGAWRRREFDIHEVAEAVEAALREHTGRPQEPWRHRPDGWRTLTGESGTPGRLFQTSDN